MTARPPGRAVVIRRTAGFGRERATAVPPAGRSAKLTISIDISSVDLRPRWRASRQQREIAPRGADLTRLPWHARCIPRGTLTAGGVTRPGPEFHRLSPYRQQGESGARSEMSALPSSAKQNRFSRLLEGLA